MLFTTPFALLGDDAAPSLWLVVARAGGLLAIAMAFRLGTPARRPARGDDRRRRACILSRGLRPPRRARQLRGAARRPELLAVERHLDGRRERAFARASAPPCCDRRSGRSGGSTGSGWPATPRARCGSSPPASPPSRSGGSCPEYLGSGGLPARRHARARAQPGLGGVRRPPGLRGAGALGGPPRPRRLARRAVVARARRRCAAPRRASTLGFGAGAVAPAGRRRADDPGRLRGQPALRRAARRARVRARRRGLGTARGRLGGGPRSAGGRRRRRSAARGAVAAEDMRSRRAAEWDHEAAYDSADRPGRRRGRGATAAGPCTPRRFQVPTVAWRLDRRLRDVEIFPNPPGARAAPAPGSPALSREPALRAAWPLRQRVASGPCPPTLMATTATASAVASMNRRRVPRATVAAG